MRFYRIINAPMTSASAPHGASAFYAPAWPYGEGVWFYYVEPFTYGDGDPAAVPTRESLLHDPPLRARGRFENTGEGPTAALRIAITHAAPILPDRPNNPRPALVLDRDGPAPLRMVEGHLVIDDPRGAPHRFRRVDRNTHATTRNLVAQAGPGAGIHQPQHAGRHVSNQDAGTLPAGRRGRHAAFWRRKTTGGG